MSPTAMITGIAASTTVLLWTHGGPSVGQLRRNPRPAERSHRNGGVVAFAMLVLVSVSVGNFIGSPLFAVGLPAVYGLGRLGLAARSTAHAARTHSTMAPVVVELIAQRLRAGNTALTALRSLDEPQAHAVGVGSVVAQVDAGTSLAEALSEKQESNGLRAALLAVELSGGAGAAAVERLADRLRLSAGTEATARSQSGQQLASASLMAALPPVIALLYALSDHRAAEFYATSVLGSVVLVFSSSLSGFSWLWMRWILQSRSVR